MLSSAHDVHQRGGRRPEYEQEQQYGGRDEVKEHARARHAIFEGSSAVTFAIAAVVLLVILVGGVLLFVDSSGNRVAEIENRYTAMNRVANPKKRIEEQMARSADDAATSAGKRNIRPVSPVSQDDRADSYARKVREKYHQRLAHMQEMQERQAREASSPEPEAIAHEVKGADAFQNQADAVPAPEAPAANAVPPRQDASDALEQSLKAIQDQLARLQEGMNKKQGENPTQPPSAAPQADAVRKAELDALIQQMAALRAQSAALEAAIEKAKGGT
ncbi:unnamed protein product (mitochondrion) [Plasmodiophora brassicae]|uniref:Transmembrane protein n=1 Tax=Plasmodiophora brassicae TaxID=37360 RepID=A0A3P3YC67_PLABS|nr:unnamed protein product [Plasmodiophora brassicae]